MRIKTTAQITQRFGFIALIAVIWFTTVGCSKAEAQSAPGVRSAVPEISGMVWIKPGTFTMGSPVGEPGRDDDETQHQVTLTQGFYMGKYPVTQAQYEEVMGKDPNYFHGGPGREPYAGETQKNRPVEQVSWYDAILFCNKLSIKEGLNPVYRINGSTNPADWGSPDRTWDGVQLVAGNGYRLPTEAQWEYACRAGTTTAYNTGTIDYNIGWYGNNSGK